MLKEDYVKILEDNKDLLKQISFDSKYPGNLSINISIYNTVVKLYPDLDLNKKTFLGLVKLYLKENNIDGAYCHICGKLCNVKSDYSFFETCSKECGRIIAAKNTSLSYKDKSKDEKEKIKEKRKQTCLEKYGTTSNLNSESTLNSRKEKFNGSISPFNLKSIRDDIALNNSKKHNGQVNAFQWEETKNKIKETKQFKYGNEKYNNIEKAQETNINKYGVNTFLITSECKELSKQKAQELYGVDYFSQANEIKEKIMNTNKIKYGKDYYIQTDEFKEKSRQACLEAYGVEYNCLRKEVRDKSRGKSKINAEWKDYLGITNEEIVLGRYSYDLECNGTLIEINPTITHNSTLSIFKNDIPKDSMYHYNKTKFANDKGYRCINVWDWDNTTKIKNLICNKNKLYARKLILKEIELKECNKFLNMYHLQNTCKGQEIRLGLYNNAELIQLMTFGKSRYNKKYEWELLRLCTKPEYYVVGGANKLFSYFITKYNPSSIISYCDKSKFTGDVYLRLGMKLLKWNKPSKHWYNPKTQRHILDSLLRQRGYSQLHKDTIHKKGESNELLMLEAKYLEVYDAGQATYIWNGITKE